MATCWLLQFSTLLVCLRLFTLCETSNECLKRKNLDLVPIILGYGTCLKFAMNLTHLDLTEVNMTSKDLTAADNDICKDNFMVPCFLSYEIAIKSCLSHYSEQHVNTIMRSSTAALKYVCQDNGQYVKDSINDCHCFSESKVALRECSVSRTLQWRWFTLSYLGEDCRKRAKLIICMLGALDKCQDKTAKSFFLGVVRAMLSETSCADIISDEFPYLSSSFLIFPAQILVFLSVILLSLV